MHRFFSIVLIGLLSFPYTASAFDTPARAAFVVDQKTGAVLFEKNADQALPPASMSKLMTLYLLFESLRDGRVTMDTKFPVSAKAHAMKGSTMFLRIGERVSVRDLIQGIIVQSGNDACVTVAEGLTQFIDGKGSEAEFARLMTNRAKEIGLTNSTFANATGWPHPAQRMSARDLVFLAEKLISEFPEYYKFFSQADFTWDGITQKNRNPLLGLGIGADGLKTGHTEEAGYGLVGSTLQGDRRVIFMLTGLNSKAERASESERIANWAMRQFSVKEIFDKETRVAMADVWMGAERQVGLKSDTEINIIVPYNSEDQIKAEVVYNGPLAAPIKKDDIVANLIITVPGLEPVEHVLRAEHDVALGGVTTRVKSSALKLTRQLIGRTGILP